jgi:hypothetical protein
METHTAGSEPAGNALENGFRARQGVSGAIAWDGSSVGTTVCASSSNAVGVNSGGKGSKYAAGEPRVDALTLSPGTLTYFMAEKAAGIRILFCWLTKNSRVLGGQLASF